jgi:molybdopterin-biosynthesis enzyme MoeA-like protein
VASGSRRDDITRDVVAAAFFRDVHVDRDVARRFLRDNAWANERIAAATTFPVDAEPLDTPTGGVPGFRLHHTYVLPGVPAEMRAMFRGLTLPVPRVPIHRTEITLDTTEDRIATILEEFGREHPAVRLGSYPDLDADPVGAENPVTSCDLHILVYEAAEPVSSQLANWAAPNFPDSCYRS